MNEISKEKLSIHEKQIHDIKYLQKILSKKKEKKKKKKKKKELVSLYEKYGY